MAKVLVTGAGGFLGRWVAKVFMEAGHQVRAGDLARADMSKVKELGAEAVLCDLRDQASLEHAVKDREVVVHVAGLFDLAADKTSLWQVNAEGARVIARTAVESGVKKFVLISTSGVYGASGKNATEEAPKTPRNTYERSKWAGEKFARAECTRGGVPMVALRPTLIYGPYGRYGLAPWLALLSVWHERGVKQVRVRPGGPLCHHVHVEDVARAAEFVASANGEVEECYNVADEAPLAGGDLLRIMASHYDLKVLNLGVPWWICRQGFVRSWGENFLRKWNPKLIYHWSMIVAQKGLEGALSPRLDPDWLGYLTHDHTYDISRLKALGFEFKHPDVREGLPATISWYRDRRWII